MGHRLELYTDEKSAYEMIEIAGKYNVEGKVVGRCEESSVQRLTIHVEQGQFEYGG